MLTSSGSSDCDDNMHDQPTALSPDQVTELGDVLRRAGLPADGPRLAALEASIASSMRAWDTAHREPLLSARRSMLRDLLSLLHQVDPPVGQIRARLRGLPEPVVRHLDRRAARLACPILGECLPTGGVRAWAEIATTSDLVMFLPALIVEGAVVVPGRRRADGTRRAHKVEPVILGSAHGLHKRTEDNRRSPVYANGRPALATLDLLIAFLAVDWYLATSAMPDRGRSDASPFGDLVHTVFGWIEAADQASGALRRYWEKVKVT